MSVEAQGGMHRVLVINPYIPARTELLGTNAKQASSVDVGKPVKLSGVTTALCAYGDPIFGFVESVEVGSKNGYSIAGILSDTGCEAYAKDEVGNLAVGDFVVAGTPAAFGTAVHALGANVIKQQAVPGGNQALSSGAIAIKAGGSAIAKTASTIIAMINGQYVTKGVGDLSALSGVIATATSNVFCWFMDASGTYTTAMGTAGATVGAVEFPAVPADKVMVGFVMISNATGSDFTGGSTALDASNLTVAFVNTPVAMGQGSAAADKWQVMAKYTAGSFTGGVLLRKV